MSMDITHLMDEKLNEREPFWFLMTVHGPAEAASRLLRPVPPAERRFRARRCRQRSSSS